MVAAGSTGIEYAADDDDDDDDDEVGVCLG
jgi:hypothetical protein